MKPLDWLILLAVAVFLIAPVIASVTGFDHTTCADLRGPEGCK